MKLKMLGVCFTMVLFAMPSYAGLKLGNVLKTPSTSTSSEGAGQVAVPRVDNNPNQQRRNELNTMIEAAPDRTVAGLEKYFAQKFGVPGAKKNSSERTAWRVRINEIGDFHNCLLVKVTEGNFKGPAYLDMTDASCDHASTQYAPVVWEYIK